MSMQGKNKKCEHYWLKNLKGRENSEEVGVDRKIILEWMLRKWDGKLWTGLI